MAVRTGDGPGRLLVTVYGVFAVSAAARALLQILTKFGNARLAYALSAFAAAVYIVATVGLARNNRRLAAPAIIVEQVGVLVVGTLSLVDRSAFPDATVWSDFGQGYGYVPLVLPMFGLFWLQRTRRAG